MLWTQVTDVLGWIPPRIVTGEAVRTFIPPEKDRYATYLVGQGVLARGFGMRSTRTGLQRPHGALDCGGPLDTEVLAARSGIVEWSGQANGYGECLLIRHSDGSTALYAHLNERIVPQGAIVLGGQQVAKMGRTCARAPAPENRGSWGMVGVDPRCRCRFAGQTTYSTIGVHLHFGVHGIARSKLPADHATRLNLNTDIEANLGSDPVAWLQEHGVSLSRA